MKTTSKIDILFIFVNNVKRMARCHIIIIINYSTSRHPYIFIWLCGSGIFIHTLCIFYEYSMDGIGVYCVDVEQKEIDKHTHAHTYLILCAVHDDGIPP